MENFLLQCKNISDNFQGMTKECSEFTFSIQMLDEKLFIYTQLSMDERYTGV